MQTLDAIFMQESNGSVFKVMEKSHKRCVKGQILVICMHYSSQTVTINGFWHGCSAYNDCFLNKKKGVLDCEQNNYLVHCFHLVGLCLFMLLFNKMGKGKGVWQWIFFQTEKLSWLTPAWNNLV
ncbi:hypothetical protein ILYODFUR_028920 [Ilyodon furcidens]|uniref:Uncharacterized protein n=1 Tax=Ilyodon furcidens TaxID=33524 RepID=A0ABV0VIZ5_9TELE